MLPVITMMLALVSLAFGILYTLATRVAFRGDPLRVLALLWADTRLFFATRDGPLVVPTARDKETTMTALLQEMEILLLSVAVNGDSLDVRVLGTKGDVYVVTLGASQMCSCPAFRFKLDDAQCKHLAWLRRRCSACPRRTTSRTSAPSRSSSGYTCSSASTSTARSRPSPCARLSASL